VKSGKKAELPLSVKRGIIPLLSVEATGVCIPIGNTEMLLAALYKPPQRLWSDKDITKLFGF
jgi:hypothetical protein